MTMPVIPVHFFVIPGVVKLRMLGKFCKEMLDYPYDQVSALGICIHINGIYIKLQRDLVKIIVKKCLNEKKACSNRIKIVILLNYNF